jgi:hypothetical protein
MVDRVVQGGRYILRAGMSYGYANDGKIVVALGDGGGWNGDYVDVRVEENGTFVERVHLSHLE